MWRKLTFVLSISTFANVACDSAVSTGAKKDIELSISGLRPLDPASEGSYEGWVVEAGGMIKSTGRFSITSDPMSVTVSAFFANPEHFMITVEPPGDDDTRPSDHKLMGGRFVGNSATLDVTGYVTVVGVPLETQPGVHILATPTDDDVMGHPSREDAGLWLFNPAFDTLHASYYADFAPITDGWRYEGWVVHNYGNANATWISYGKFRPDPFRQANLRDDTGLGIFSGRRDYEFALGLALHVPGDDWLSDSLGLATLPFGMPLDLNGDAAVGVVSEWTHVITIEPWGPNREAELPTESRPFFLEVYRNAIGEAAPTIPRVIEFIADVVPSGVAAIR